MPSHYVIEDRYGGLGRGTGVLVKDNDYLILSIIHSAKGGRTPTAILNALDGCIPSYVGTGTSEEIDEERRLLYVAMTRAKDSLTLDVPRRFYVTQQSRSGDRQVAKVLLFHRRDLWIAVPTARNRPASKTAA